MINDYYQVLGVKRGASEKDLRRSYRKLARKYHPDVNHGDKSAEDKFKKVNHAYEVLSDPEKRRKYDQHGENWEQASQMEDAVRGTGFSGAPSDIGDIFGKGGGGFDSVLEGLFGKTRGQRRTMRGQNIEYKVAISLEEAFSGCIRKIQMQAEDPMEIKIPPGVKTGSRVRIHGEGRPSPTGGPRGDLYLVVKVQAHKTFDRKGNNLHINVNIPLEDAILGSEVTIPTISKKNIALKIPPLTQNGMPFKLSGLGMPKLKGGKTEKGDLIATLQVTLPEKLTEKEKDLFQQLREIHSNEKAKKAEGSDGTN